MNPELKSRVVRFLNDEATAQAVYSFLEESFLKDKGKDVYILAAGKLSLDNLREAWKEMEKCRRQDDDMGERKQTAL